MIERNVTIFMYIQVIYKNFFFLKIEKKKTNHMISTNVRTTHKLLEFPNILLNLALKVSSYE